MSDVDARMHERFATAFAELPATPPDVARVMARAGIGELTPLRRRGSAVPASTARRRRRLAATGAALAAAGTAAIAAFGLSGSPAFALDTLPDGRIQVRVATDFNDAAALQDRLRSAGFDIKVMTVAEPCQAGKVISAGVNVPVVNAGDRQASAVSVEGDSVSGLPTGLAGFTLTEDGFIVGPAPIDPDVRLVIGVDDGGEPCTTAP